MTEHQIDVDDRAPARSKRFRLTPRAALGVIAALFVVCSLVVAVATPWGEANDEPDHVLNVETLLDGRWYRIEDGAGLQPHQPPLYYGVLAAWQKVLGVPPRLELPTFGHPSAGFFRHDVREDGERQRLYVLLRLPSILLGLMTIAMTALIAKRLSTEPWTPVVAASVVAFLPRFLFLSGVLNNDNLANALASAATLLAVVIVTARLRSRTYLLAAAGLGACAGLMAITKISTLPLVAGFVLAILLARARYRLWGVGAFFVAMVATSGWWFVLNQHRYGHPIARQASEEYLERIVPGIIAHGLTTHRAFVEIPKIIWYSFVYSSGWAQFRWGDWWYLPFWLLLFGGIVGVAIRARGAVSRRGELVLAVLGLAALASIWIVAIDTTTLAARIAFTGLPAIAVLVALGYERLRVPVLARFSFGALGVIGIAIALHRDVLDRFV